MDHESIIETREGNIQIVRYNKPARKNAIDAQMYCKVKTILNNAARTDDIAVTVLTGTGDFYSSGNDFRATPVENKNFDVLSDYIKAFITYPKLLVAIVNGPAIGIAATTLALCDLVFASETSYFYTPFSKLGIVAEGCSTFTFPRLIGERKAADMLLYNYKMSAKEALDWGFVNYLYKPCELQTKVWNKIIEVSNLPQMSMSLNKKILRGTLQNQLLKTNAREIAALSQIWQAGAAAEKSDHCVVDVRVLSYNPDGTIFYKLNFLDDFTPLPRRPKKMSSLSDHVPQLYHSRQAISKIKYDHLQELKSVIPSDCHEFYNNLAFY